MANPPKHKGTNWEQEVVQYLRDQGWIHAERRALGGANDRGDIAGIPGIVIECKSTKRITLADFVDEAVTEMRNDGAKYGVAWVKRRGRASAAHGYVCMTGEQFSALLSEAGYGPAHVKWRP